MAINISNEAYPFALFVAARIVIVLLVYFSRTPLANYLYSWSYAFWAAYLGVIFNLIWVFLKVYRSVPSHSFPHILRLWFMFYAITSVCHIGWYIFVLITIPVLSGGIAFRGVFNDLFESGVTLEFGFRLNHPHRRFQSLELILLPRYTAQA